LTSTKVEFDALRLLILSPPQFFLLQETRFGKSIKTAMLPEDVVQHILRALLALC